MNFCSIEDAWGDNKISAQYQKYNNDKKCSDPTKIECKMENKHVEQFSNKEVNIITCEDIMKHISTCKQCYNKL